MRQATETQYAYTTKHTQACAAHTQPPPHAPRPVIYVFFTNPDEACRCSRARPFSHPRDKSEDGVHPKRRAASGQSGTNWDALACTGCPALPSDLQFSFRGDWVAPADFINGFLNSISRVLRSLFTPSHARADCNSIVRHMRESNMHKVHTNHSQAPGIYVWMSCRAISTREERQTRELVTTRENIFPGAKLFSFADLYF